MVVATASDALRRALDDVDGLGLVLLHGSRAAGDAHEGSDWDLAYLGDEAVDPVDLHVSASVALGTDRIDVVDLARASALLRLQAARHGRVITETVPGTHHAFVLEATQFWCDAGWVIRHAQEAVLRGLAER